MIPPDASSLDRAVAWYAEGMRLWKRGPGMLALLAAIAVIAQVGLELIPDAGSLIAKVLAPLVGCCLVYAAEALERGERARPSMAWRAFAAPPAAIAAIVAASTVTFAIEWIAAHALAGIDLLRPASAPADTPASVVMAVYAAGIAASLPLAFVPYAALLEGRGFAASFSASFAAFAAQPVAFVAYGAIAFLLIMLGLATMGIALVVALPLVACATYAAWRDPATHRTRERAPAA